MAQTITIKQSTSTDAPTTLTNAELAYSASSNKLWIGRPGGLTSNVDAIGGKYFTDRSIETNGLSFNTSTGVLTINQVGTNLDETVDLDGRYLQGVATTTALGGIKLYNGTAQSTSANAVTTTALRTYGIQLNSSEQAVVNVPWVNTEYTAGTGLSLSSTTFNANVDGTNSATPSASTNTVGRTYKVQVDGSDNLVVNVPWSSTDVSGYMPLTGGTFSGNVTFGDGDELRFGDQTDGDLVIQHTASVSRINDKGTGSLEIITNGTGIDLKGGSGNNYIAKFISNGAVELNYGSSSSKKFETTATGVEVTGNIVTTGNITGPSAFTITPATSSGTVTIDGNLTVSGTTTTIDSTTVTIEDPIFTLGGDTPPSTDDNLDRGIEFRWHNATAAKLGFFGFDDSTGEFTFIPEATNTSNVMSGTKGTANFGSLKLDTDLAVAYGGTGRSSFTTNGIAYGNGALAMGVTVAGVWDSTNSVGQLLSVNSSGVPTWTNNIDGGTF
jgi:hypothetical protein